MKRLLIVALCSLIALPGCAVRRTANVGFVPPPPPPRTGGQVDPVLMAGYVRQLPIGSRVKINLADGKVMNAILMKHDADPIVVQRRARIPEAPVEIALREILALEVDTSTSNPGRTFAIGAGAAVSATLGVILLLAAIFSD